MNDFILSFNKSIYQISHSIEMWKKNLKIGKIVKEDWNNKNTLYNEKKLWKIKSTLLRGERSEIKDYILIHMKKWHFRRRCWNSWFMKPILN